MELYFFRHGIAIDRDDPECPPDQDRPLTEEGIRKTREAAEGLKRLNIEFDRILTSPWLRASQTAQILAESLVVENDLEELPELAGDRSVEDLIAALKGRGSKRLILVGHQPLLGQSISHLLSPNALLNIDLKKSGAAALKLDKLPTHTPATLLWLLTSRQLRLIGKS